MTGGWLRQAHLVPRRSLWPSSTGMAILSYKTDNYQNNWDGTYNGKLVDGTYYFTVTYTTITDKTILLKET